jgi:hypothetical protein
VSGHPGQMCRDIADTLNPRHRLVERPGSSVSSQISSPFESITRICW